MVKDPSHARADWAILALVALVAVVIIGGFLATRGGVAAPSNTAGAAVTLAPGDDLCRSCAGDPVCAAKDGRISTFENACAAECAGARVVFDAPCEMIPRQ